MGKRGRPPHPDILTPREWQVLAFLREGLTNEQIAQRLDISYATAKYHVAEIISKLGVQTREEAASWQPPEPGGWREWVLAPLFRSLRRISPLTLTKAAIAAASLAAIVGLLVLGWVVLRTDGNEQAQARNEGNFQATPTDPAVTQVPIPTQTPTSTQAPIPAIPSGPAFAYAAPDGTIWLYDLERDESVPLITQSLNQFGVQGWAAGRANWAPRGRWIAFLTSSQDQYGVGTLNVLDLSTGATRSVATEVRGWGWVPASDILWLQTGNFELELSVFDANSGATRHVASGTSNVSWSPEGKRLVFNQIGERDEGGTATRFDLYAVDLTSGETELLGQGATNEFWWIAPHIGSWSPDGRYAAYWLNTQSGSAVQGDVCVREFDGHDEVCLGQFSSDERPQWAPSSSIYIFHNYVLRPDPLRAEELFARPGAVLSWSPDGTKVALVHGRPFGEGPRSLVVLDINTMQQQTYHTYDVDVPHAGSPGFYTTWSNDSRYLAFSSRESLTADVLSLRIADTTTGTVNLIDEAVPRYASVSYSPDSSALLIQDGSPSIWVAGPDGSNRRLVAQGQLIGSASGPWYPGEPAPH